MALIPSNKIILAVLIFIIIGFTVNVLLRTSENATIQATNAEQIKQLCNETLDEVNKQQSAQIKDLTDKLIILENKMKETGKSTQ